jgi:hypothetical protein
MNKGDSNANGGGYHSSEDEGNNEYDHLQIDGFKTNNQSFILQTAKLKYPGTSSNSATK